MRIGELSRRTGVSIRLLRYYEEQGLLTADRSGTGHRRYEADAALTVNQIRTLLAAGLPTAVIREVLCYGSHIVLCPYQITMRSVRYGSRRDRLMHALTGPTDHKGARS